MPEILICVQALQAVTTPVADLAARASQMNPAMLAQAQDTAGSYNGSDDGQESDADGHTDMDYDSDQGGQNDDVASEVSLTPHPVPGGQGGGVAQPKRLDKDGSLSKRGIRFAAGTNESAPEHTAMKKVHKPFANIKDSVYMAGNAFDFHGTPLEDEDDLSITEQDSDANTRAQPGQMTAPGGSSAQHRAEHSLQDWWVTCSIHGCACTRCFSDLASTTCSYMLNASLEPLCIES